ncbi:MAG: hypothetical protein SGJ20_14670 [Planctomycetota bacterium]|nr:hypothetical protein [Planctomycetota bacterium]
MQSNSHTTGSGIPPLAGLCSLERAMADGLSVEECVSRLKHFHYAFKRLHEIFTARITAEPLYELKSAMSHHAYLCSEHVAAIRSRVGEMREPPLGLEQVPNPHLKFFFDEILAAPATGSLLLGIYDVAVGNLIDAVQRYLRQTHPLADAPSVRLCRFALLELQDMRRFGQEAIRSVVDEKCWRSSQEWLGLLERALAAAGGIAGDDGESIATELTIKPMYSATPYQYDPVPKRDARFQDSYNAGVNAEAFLYDDRFSARDKTVMMYYKRLREIDVPEMMASIITQTPGKPWNYYLAMTRQLWDEARHAMMGEVGFTRLGIDWTQIPINFTWSLNLNTQLTPIERHAVLFYIEQGLMPKNGKRYEWEVATQSGDPLSRLFQDFDWADEVLHARIGRDWYVKDFADLKESLDYGDRCWTKVVSQWRQYLEAGLTQHRNWWPAAYQAACAHWQVEPDPAALAFNTTYETQRADLKIVSVSG